MQVDMINFRLDSRLGVMAPMVTSKNTASGETIPLIIGMVGRTESCNPSKFKHSYRI